MNQEIEPLHRDNVRLPAERYGEKKIDVNQIGRKTIWNTTCCSGNYVSAFEYVPLDIICK